MKSNVRELSRNRRGMTLVELLVSLVILSLITGSALNFVYDQSRGLRVGSEEAETVQNLRYALLRLEGDLRTLGTNVPAGQPSLAYAGPNLVAFFTDYASNIENDFFAVHYTPGAPGGQVSAPATAVGLPGTAVALPDTLYQSQGLLSPAELLIFYFELDATTADPLDHVLYRKVNHGQPEVIAKNLRQKAGTPFFRYMRIRDTGGIAGLRLDSIPDNQLPLVHTVRSHGSPADSAASARTDSIRGVRISVKSVGTEVEGYLPEIQSSRVIRFPNAGLSRISTCGSRPILGVAPVAVLEVVGGTTQIRISWPSASDEAAGERDVVGYVLWRRTAANPVWGDPFRSIPAGQVNYTTVDGDIVSGEQYRYALAAQDCTPSISTTAISAPVNVP